MLDITRIISDLFQVISGFNLFHIINIIPLPHVGVGGEVEAKASVNLIDTLIFTAVFLLGTSGVFGLGLAFAAKKFSVKMDPRIEQVKDKLAGRSEEHTSELQSH